ncbi:MAG: UvrD-helicase domain-containing protein, partial [Acidimicrobiales bacterium]
MDPERLLAGLDEAQRHAVLTPHQPLCIVAPAGSGKTRVLTRRIAYRAETGDLDPRRVLALTFTRKAAAELRSRLGGLGLRDLPAAGTFHAVAYAQLHERWRERDVRPPTLLERKAQLLAELAGRGAPAGPGELAAVIDWAQARGVSPARYEAECDKARRRPAGGAAWAAQRYADYVAAKTARRLVDFDDLLRLCARHLERDHGFAAAIRWRFRHVFVDEFQDVNPLQLRLLDAWLGGRGDLCVVGDPHQAIYGWNGADAAALAAFGDRFPGGEVVRLSRNYRSSRQIVAAAAAVLDADPAAAAGPDGPAPSVAVYDDEAAEAA